MTDPGPGAAPDIRAHPPRVVSVAASEAPQPVGATMDDISAALARIESAQAALQKQVEALQDHSNLVGYLVEQMLARTSHGWTLARAARWLTSHGGRAKGFASRLRAYADRLRPLTRPRATAQALRREIGTALITSRRTHWSQDEQRWRQRLNWLLFATRALAGAGGVLINRKQKLYAINQRRPTVSHARPRIMHVIPNVHVGGSTQLIVDLFDYLGHKYDMQVVTSSMPAGGSHSGMIIHDLREPTSTASFVELFGKFAPDLLHVHYWGETDSPWYDKAFGAARRAELRIVENINTPVAPRVDALVARYVYVSEYVRRRFGAGSEDETVIHPGIDLAKFSPRAFDAHALDSIGMVYRLEGDKLNADSIEPLIRTVLMRPRTRAFVIGAGSLLDVFLRRVEKAGVRDNFVFTGYVPYAELPDYYAQFRTFVAPVWQESFGQVAAFAMNMGLAVAGNRIGALPEILGSDDTLGGSIEETAAILVALLEDPDKIRNLGAHNRTRAQQMFEVADMCRKYTSVYQDVLGESDPMPGFPPAEIFAEL